MSVEMPNVIREMLESMRGSGIFSEVYLTHKERICKAIYIDKDVSDISKWDIVIFERNHPELTLWEHMTKEVVTSLEEKILFAKESL